MKTKKIMKPRYFWKITWKRLMGWARTRGNVFFSISLEIKLEDTRETKMPVMIVQFTPATMCRYPPKIFKTRKACAIRWIAFGMFCVNAEKSTYRAMANSWIIRKIVIVRMTQKIAVMGNSSFKVFLKIHICYSLLTIRLTPSFILVTWKLTISPNFLLAKRR